MGIYYFAVEQDDAKFFGRMNRCLLVSKAGEPLGFEIRN